MLANGKNILKLIQMVYGTILLIDLIRILLLRKIAIKSQYFMLEEL